MVDAQVAQSGSTYKIVDGAKEPAVSGDSNRKKEARTESVQQIGSKHKD